MNVSTRVIHKDGLDFAGAILRRMKLPLIHLWSLRWLPLPTLRTLSSLLLKTWRMRRCTKPVVSVN